MGGATAQCTVSNDSRVGAAGFESKLASQPGGMPPGVPRRHVLESVGSGKASLPSRPRRVYTHQSRSRVRRALVGIAMLQPVFLGRVKTGAWQSESTLQAQVARQASELAVLKDQLLGATREVATSATAPTHTALSPPTPTELPRTPTHPKGPTLLRRAQLSQARLCHALAGQRAVEEGPHVRR